MKHITFILLLLIGLSACEKADLNTSTGSVNRAVVESFLQPGALPVVHVKKQIAYNSSDSIQEAITGLNILLTDIATGQQYSMAKGDTTAYVADGSWQIEAGKTYQLSFEYDGKTITAETVIPSKPVNFTSTATSIEGFDPGSFTPGSGGPPSFPDPITLSWDAGDDAYYLIVVQTATDNQEKISTDTSSGSFFGGLRRFSFRSEPLQTNTWTINAPSFEYYGLHYVILYRLNTEYAALYEDSGSNSNNLTTPYTNVTGGLGIFTGMNADTISITVTK